jgi:tRNA (uracil-5-)-methyltransferase TRM9
VSPSRGRILIYVWAIEQDELSRRSVPTESYTRDDSVAESDIGPGRDVFVPWVLTKQNTNNGKSKGRLSKGPLASKSDVADSCQSCTNGTSIEVTPMSGPDEPQVFNRYYHMFAEGELAELVRSAAGDLGIHIGPIPDQMLSSGLRTEWKGRGLEIVQDGWERSNYFIELRCWEN